MNTNLFGEPVEQPRKGRMVSPGKNRPEQDVVMTPFPLALNIINHFQPTGKILDPCRGQGAFYNQYPTDAVTDWCEILEGRNFLNYDGKVDWIITNPPWSMMRKFLQKGMAIADNVVYLVAIVHYSTKARLREIKGSGFGIKEFYCVPHPKDDAWPQSGFQLAAVHIKRGWGGPATYSGQVGK